MLVEEGTFVNATDQGNETALHEAAANGHDIVARLLIKGKADVDAKQFVSLMCIEALKLAAARTAQTHLPCC